MKKIIILAMLVGVISLLGACKAEEAAGVADTITLGAQPADKVVEAYGVIKALDIRNITIDFPAIIDQINVKDGQMVQKGDELMSLNIEDFQAQIKGQEADVNIQKSQIKETEADVNIQKSQKEISKEQKDKLTVMEDSLALMKGKLDKANVNQNQIISDIDQGMVYNIENVPGDMVSSGTRLISIANLDTLIVSANIDQQFISMVKVGAEVFITP